MRRFFVEQENIGENVAFLGEEERNHLVNVLRMRVGDGVILICGDGYDYIGKIDTIEKREVRVEITQKEKNVAETKCNVHLFQAVAKGEKLELITQKFTELGGKKIVPFTSKFTIAKESKVKLERLNKITREAVKQCGRSDSVIIEEPLKFEQIIERLGYYDLVILAYEKESDGSLKDVVKKAGSVKNVAIIVGSEGGFDVDEVQMLIEKANAKSITLGKRILRLETASIALTSLVMFELGEM